MCFVNHFGVVALPHCDEIAYLSLLCQVLWVRLFPDSFISISRIALSAVTAHPYERRNVSFVAVYSTFCAFSLISLLQYIAITCFETCPCCSTVSGPGPEPHTEQCISPSQLFYCVSVCVALGPLSLSCVSFDVSMFIAAMI